MYFILNNVYLCTSKKIDIYIMKKIVLALALTLAVGNIFAQEDAAKDSIPDGWTKGGNVLLTFSQ